MNVTFGSSYETTAEILTGPAGPNETYIREESSEPDAGSGRYVPVERVHRGRVFRAAAGDEVDLTEAQVAYIERDAPLVLGRRVSGAGVTRAHAVTHPSRVVKTRD